MRISDLSSDVCSSDLEMARKKAVSVPPREAKLFRNNMSQALRIPADFELPGDRVMIHRDGDRLIIVPVRRKNLLEVLASLQPLGPDDQFPDEIGRASCRARVCQYV